VLAEIQALTTLRNAKVTLGLSSGLKASNSRNEVTFDAIDSNAVQAIPIVINPVEPDFQKLTISVRAETSRNGAMRDTNILAYDEVGFFYDKQAELFRMETMNEAITSEYRIWNLIPEDSLRARGDRIQFEARAAKPNSPIARPAIPHFIRRPKLDHKSLFTVDDFTKFDSIQIKKDTSARTNPDNLVCVTVTGYLYYENSSGTSVPLPNATVDIYEDDLLWDDYITSTITDASGRFSVYCCDDDGLFDSHLEIYAFLKTINDRVSVLNYTQPGGPLGFNPFAWATWVVETGGGTVDYGNLLISGSSLNRGGAKIFDNMQKAWAASVGNGFNPSYTPVVYPAPTSQCGGNSCYSYQTFPGTSLGAIYMQSGEWLNGNEDVSYHEYGHALMHRAFPNAWYPNTGGGSHTTFPQPAGFAWSEGWATFYTQVVQGDGYWFGLSLENKSSIDLVYPTTGEVNEWRVAQAMVDLFDQNADGDDYGNIPFNKFISTMQSNVSNSLTQFWSQLRNILTASEKHFGSRALIYNTIPVVEDPLLPPIIANLSPNPVTVYRGTSSTVVCNLSQGTGVSYTWTPYYFPSNLTMENHGSYIVLNYLETALADVSGDSPNEPAPYVVCTASNSLGNSTATCDIYMSYGPPPGSCPFVYAWNGRRYVEDNNILPQSEDSVNAGRDVLDRYKLQKTLVPRNRKYSLLIREDAREHSWLDNVKLIAVDHPLNVNVAMNDDGEITSYIKPHKLRHARFRGNDVLRELAAFDSVSVSANGGEIFSFGFVKPNGGNAVTNDEGGLEMGGEAPPDETWWSPRHLAIFGKGIKQGAGEHSIYFRHRPSLMYTPFAVGDTNDLHLVAPSAMKLDYLNLAVTVGVSPTVNELNLADAFHSTLGSVKRQLAGSDSSYVELVAGQSIELQFAASDIPPGKNRSFFLVTTGRYEHASGGGALSRLASTKTERKLPTSFALHPAYPNPFNPATVIKYELPKDSYVTLKLYDIIGREVSVLVDGMNEAGFHQVTLNASQLTSGTYLYVLTGSEFNSVKKLVLLR
jgi:hypothetical protein